MVSPVSSPASIPPITVRSVAAGLVLSLVLCAMNSYLTLSFGVIEEGPTIAALFFFAVFFMSKTKITTTEMVVVATMGSAGGSLGFISNFYAAKAMTGVPYSVLDMTLFGIVSSLVGLLMAIPLRHILILKEKLPWPGSRAVESVIRALVEEGDRRQPLILFVTFAVCGTYVVLNSSGFDMVPEETHLPIVAGVGGAIAWSPFAIGGSYLMGMRTCVGFLVGAVTLMVMAPYIPDPEPGIAFDMTAPHKFYWPGLGFLVAAGLTMMAINWRTIASAFKSILALGSKADDDDPTLSPRATAVLAVVAFTSTVIVLGWRFAIPIWMTTVLILVGGLVQNIIATRAAAQTAFNPARVMGILLQGVTSSLPGGSAAATNLTGAGFVAGSGAQASLLTADLVYGKAFRVPSRWQFWTQTSTVIPCAIISALAFSMIHEDRPLVLNAPEEVAVVLPATTGDRVVDARALLETVNAELFAPAKAKPHPAPVAKMWAQSALLFEKGSDALPEGALIWLLVGAGVGLIYTLLEAVPRLKPWLPDGLGIGLGLVLSVSLGISFFIGGFLLWIVLGRWLKIGESTLTTIAVGSIVAEGIGGVLQSILLKVV